MNLVSEVRMTIVGYKVVNASNLFLLIFADKYTFVRKSYG